MDPFKKILYEVKEGIAVICIDQLQDRNRMDRATYLEAVEALRISQEDPGVTAVIFTGKGIILLQAAAWTGIRAER